MGNGDRVCAYCGKHEVKARGLCNACYIRLQRHGDCKYRRHKTNADKIRAMTDEELAELFSQSCDCGHACCVIDDKHISCVNGCTSAWLDWLKQEATND